MQKTLGLAPVLPPAKETETAPAVETITKEPAATATPEGKPAEVVVAPQEEGKQGETEVKVEPGAEAGESVREGVKEEKEKEPTREPAKDEETTEKSSGFKQWLKSKRSQL